MPNNRNPRTVAGPTPNSPVTPKSNELRRANVNEPNISYGEYGPPEDPLPTSQHLALHKGQV